jgi:hypothetical protein
MPNTLLSILDIQKTVTRLLSLWCMQTSADRLATGKAEIDGIHIQFARPFVATDPIPFNSCLICSLLADRELDARERTAQI